MELVEKQKVLDDTGNFIQWKEFDKEYDITVYIEEEILPELDSNLITIDVATGILSTGEKMGMFFIKKSANVYG